MQSYLQYRRFGQDVQRRVNAEKSKRVEPSDPSETSTTSSHTPSSYRQQDTNIAAPDREEQQLAGRSDLNHADQDPELEQFEQVQQTSTTIGHALEDVSPRERATREGKGGQVFVVGWTGEADPMNPHNWSSLAKLMVIFRIALISFAVTMASSIDSTILPQAARDFGVSEVAESLATGNYLIGFSCGTLLAGPLSETLGRNFIYMGSLVAFMCWIVGCALAPNFGAQITFRWLAGFFGSPSLTVSGGSIADLYDPLSKTYAFPLYAISGFGGPILGPVIGAYIGPANDRGVISWKWVEWVSLIAAALTLVVIVLFQPETYAPLLLRWKAAQLRKHTGDDRFKAELEIMGESLAKRCGVALARPFLLVKSELIVGLMSFYMTVIYIVLFTFLDGYTYIFEDVYGTSQGLTEIIFTAMFIGVLLSLGLVPLMYSWTKKHIEYNKQLAVADGDEEPGIKISPETRLWFAMLGAPAMPISLFWMGWTDYATISIWSPIIASVFFGYSVICVFMSAYMYIIDSYEVYAASGLTFVALVRYIAAGGMTVVGIPFYKNVGTHWTLTAMGIISLVCTPIPYALYIWGPKIRRFSKYAVNKSN